jgi:hypothetical protein
MVFDGLSDGYSIVNVIQRPSPRHQNGEPSQWEGDDALPSPTGRGAGGEGSGYQLGICSKRQPAQRASQ